MRLVSAFGLELRGVGVLDFGDKVHQFYRVAAADVVHLVGHAVRAFRGDRHVVERMHAAFRDVVDVGEVANHVAVVEHLDGLALRDSAGKEHRAHVGAAPRAVNRKVAQARRRNPVEFRVGMRHQLVALLARRIQTNRIVDLVVLAVGHLAVEAINGTRRGVEQVRHTVIAACLQDVQEPDHVALHVGIRVRDGVAHAGLCREVHHLAFFHILTTSGKLHLCISNRLYTIINESNLRIIKQH